MISAQTLVTRLREKLPPAAEGEVEGVHDLRVACARLDTFLRLAGQPDLREDLRRLRRSAAEARNLDVTLAQVLPPGFRRWLDAQQPEAQEQLRRSIAHKRTLAVLAAIESLPALSDDDIRAGRAAFARRALKRMPDDTHDLEAWHRLRRTLRHVRYTTEWLDEDAGALKAIQDSLGVHSDALALSDWLEVYPGRTRRLRALNKAQLALGVDPALPDRLTAMLRAMR